MKKLDKWLSIFGLQRIENDPFLIKQELCKHEYGLNLIIDEEGFYIDPNQKIISHFLKNFSKAKINCVKCNKKLTVSYVEWVSIKNGQNNKKEYEQKKEKEFDGQFLNLKNKE